MFCFPEGGKDKIRRTVYGSVALCRVMYAVYVGLCMAMYALYVGLCKAM